MNQGRLRSLDALRGLTILVMIFVNDLAGVSGAPAWMKHFSPHLGDGMTFVDVVFPAFLFIVGMSIPLSLGRRLEGSESRLSVLGHILTRTLGLLAIGVLMVNADTMSAAGYLKPAAWGLLMYAGVFLVWGTAPRGWSSRSVAALRAAGIALLLVLAVLYRGDGAPALVELRPQWWGILGLIGWAYLVSCAVYLGLRRSLAGVVGMIPLLYALVLGVSAHLLHAARGVHPMFMINKVLATPPWCLWSSAITVAVWGALYWLIDVRQWGAWAGFLAPAGQNPLTAYLLAPAFDSVIVLLSQATGVPNVYAGLGAHFSTGLIRSVLFALLAVWLTGRLRRIGVQLAL